MRRYKLEYHTPLQLPRPRTRWPLLIFLLLLTPFFLFALVDVLAGAGWFGPMDD